MNVIYFLLPLALLLGFGFLGGFLWVVSQGQYDELETPAHRMLLDDESR
jgi:cbb3-type cytochrome oxidase maturation protein